jgi:hypothetical protein
MSLGPDATEEEIREPREFTRGRLDLNWQGPVASCRRAKMECMEIVKQGKAEVLDYLENKAKERIRAAGGGDDKEGQYLIMKDANGNLFAVIAGFTWPLAN